MGIKCSDFGFIKNHDHFQQDVDNRAFIGLLMVLRKIFDYRPPIGEYNAEEQYYELARATGEVSRRY
jgi:hypothetical protein